MGNLVRFTADVLNGVPSIVMGIVVYALIVLPQKHFSALAGGVALAIMMVPTITRTTEEMLLHGAARHSRGRLGLGVPAWRTDLIHHSAHRICGRRSPAACWPSPGWRGKPRRCSSPRSATHFWNTNLNQPIAALPLQIFIYAISPYDEWHRQAWAGALVLIVLIVASVARCVTLPAAVC